jgi:hypothetical protein
MKNEWFNPFNTYTHTTNTMELTIDSTANYDRHFASEFLIAPSGAQASTARWRPPYLELIIVLTDHHILVPWQGGCCSKANKNNRGVWASEGEEGAVWKGCTILSHINLSISGRHTIVGEVNVCSSSAIGL